MKNKADVFFENLKGKKVAFIGAGVSHKKLIEIFSQEGAVVTLCDKKTLESFGDYANTLKELGVNLSLGENYLDGLKNQDMIMRTPGFEFFTKELQDQVELGVQVTSLGQPPTWPQQFYHDDNPRQYGARAKDPSPSHEFL